MPALGGSAFGGKIYIGSDHTGYEIKEKLKAYFGEFGYEVKDMGAFKYDANDDYPDFIRPVAEAVAKDAESRGIILVVRGRARPCAGTELPARRAAVFYGEALPKEAIDIKGEKSADPFEIIKLARAHNDANILSLGVRFLSFDEIKFAAELFFATPFSRDERHIRRIKKIGLNHGK